MGAEITLDLGSVRINQTGISINKKGSTLYIKDIYFLSCDFQNIEAQDLEQGWATIFVSGPHYAFACILRATFRSKRLCQS